VPELPVWFDNLICQLLEKKPDQRPLDASMVATTLNAIQEKVEAQVSAGAEAARSRKIDRPRVGGKIDESDREAARALKGGKRKARRKTQKPHFYEQAWFVIVGIAVLLVVMTGVLYWVLGPRSADQLYAQAKPLMESNDAAKWDLALRDPLREFMARYPDAPGDKADQMRRWYGDAEYRQCFELIKTHLERVKANRPHFAADDAQEIAFPAAVAEEHGELEKAKKGWESLQAWSGAWGVYAKRRLEEIDHVGTEEARLLGELDNVKKFHRDLDKDRPDLDLLTALRYDRFRDYPNAEQRFEKLKAKFAPDINLRLWYLLAAKKGVDAKDGVKRDFGAGDPAKRRTHLIEDQLKDARDLKQSNASEAYAIVLDIIALYKDDPEKDIQKLVEEAAALKAEIGKSLSLPAS
jgi:serine/threonine-protein kinase